MTQETVKLELIEWLSTLADSDTLEYLKMIKDSRTEDDWFKNVSEEEKAGIERGLNDIKAGRVVSHAEVKKRYGL